METENVYQKVRELSVEQRMPTREIIALFPSIAPASIRTLVYKAWREQGQAVPVEQKARRSGSYRDQKPLSPTHAIIGRKLTMAANKRRLFMNREIAAETQLGTTMKVGRILAGTYDVSLLDIQRIARFCEQGVAELLNE